MGKGVVLTLFVALVALYFGLWGDLDASTSLTYTHRSLLDLATGAKHVTIYKNGFSTGGVEIELNPTLSGKDGEELAKYLSQFVQVETLKTNATNPVADRVFNGAGRRIDSFDSIQSNDKLYLVAPGLHFVFPFIHLGHKVYLHPEDSPTDQPVILESLSESPRTFKVHHFLSEAEADTLVKRILEIDDDDNKLQRSRVGHRKGDRRESNIRTSENAFDTTSPAAIAIRKRAFDVLGLGDYKPDMCDGLQLLRYQQRQAYIAHNDYFNVNSSKDNWNFDPSTGGSNRFATVFLYLSDVDKGGQTVFPYAEMPEGHAHPVEATAYEKTAKELFESSSWEYDMVQKCYSKLASYPKKANAILFYSQKPNGELDPRSFHGGCPVLEGTKWAANLWVWNKRRYGLDQNNKEKFELVFKNTSPRPVDLFWSSTKMFTLNAGEDIQYTTYHGHKWRIMDGDKELMTYVGDFNKGDHQEILVPLERLRSRLFLSKTAPDDRTVQWFLSLPFVHLGKLFGLLHPV